jgi:mRNA-degrading endonuclease RelE of RelBE toxin-antitoxin system
VAYEIRLAASAKRQLKELTARDRAVILAEIEVQLSHEPLAETRNRKQLRPNPIAPWELRVRNTRVFYDVTVGDPNVVTVLAIGIKRGNRLTIEGQEIQL